MALRREEADALADLLNQVCSATLGALLHGDPAPQALAPALQELAQQFEPTSEVARFLARLVAWLEGTRPLEDAATALPDPFGRALSTMLARVPTGSPGPAADTPPISRRVLTQLIAAVVAARASGDARVARQLAATLSTTHGRLPTAWKPTLGTLLENLRASLGGADPRRLPEVPTPYAALWQNAANLMLLGTLDEAQAHDELLDRLVHNAEFVRRAANPELSAALATALQEVQRHALAGQRPGIATLVGAIRAEMLGEDAAPLVALLEGDELAAWQRLHGETE